MEQCPGGESENQAAGGAWGQVGGVGTPELQQLPCTFSRRLGPQGRPSGWVPQGSATLTTSSW